MLLFKTQHFKSAQTLCIGLLDKCFLESYGNQLYSINHLTSVVPHSEVKILKHLSSCKASCRILHPVESWTDFSPCGLMQDREGQSSSDSLYHHQWQRRRWSPQRSGVGQHLQDAHLQVPLRHTEVQSLLQVCRTQRWERVHGYRLFLFRFISRKTCYTILSPTSAKDIRLQASDNSSEATEWSREVMRTQYEWLFISLTVTSRNATDLEDQDMIIYTVCMSRYRRTPQAL